MTILNLHMQSDWIHDENILCYTVYSINSEMMQQWSENVLTALRHHEGDTQPCLLFDLSYPNASMSYFVMSQREMFNAGITRTGKDYFLKFLEHNPTTHVKLAVVLSSTMLGALGKYMPANYGRKNFTGKLFFDRSAAEDWLRVEPGEDAHNTGSITSESLRKVIQLLETPGHDMYYGERDFLRILVNGSLEVIPISDDHPIIIGRTKNADLDLGVFGEIARSVSRRHAQVSLTDGRLSIIDLESRNGTWVSGLQIEPGETVFLRRDDIIRVGGIELSIIF